MISEPKSSDPMTPSKENSLSRLRRDPARLARSCFLAVTLLASLATGAFAAEVAVPAKGPAATLTVPDTWTTKDIDDGIQARPPDEAVAVYVNHGAARNWRRPSRRCASR